MEAYSTTMHDRPYAALFPGQGAHALTMLAAVRSLPAFPERYALVCAALGVDVAQALEEQGEVFLNRNAVSSLLTVLVSSLAYDQWYAQHGPPQWLAGYSVGQWTALYAAGVVEFAPLVALVAQRAALMDACTARHPGGMVSVIGLAEGVVATAVQQLQAEGYQVSISTYNCLGQYSLAVAADALEPTLAWLRALGPRRLLVLPVAGPWHSPLLAGAEAGFAAYLEPLVQRLPQLPVVDNVTGDLLPLELPAFRQQLVRQIRAPVRWHQGMTTLIGLGCRTFVELGYGRVLTKFGFFIDRSVHHEAFCP
jgi:[acyl-carrier-protein] S-malonyltransferase